MLVTAVDRAAEPRYFVPDDESGEDTDEGPVVSVRAIGKFCNDLAFRPGMTEDEYLSRTKDNVVQLVWRLEFDGEMLRPSWPVSVFSQDVKFTNVDPYELGTTYGWGYWSTEVSFETADMGGEAGDGGAGEDT